MLSFDGERAIDIMKELCKQMCKDDEVSLQTPTLDAGQSSVQSSEVYKACTADSAADKVCEHNCSCSGSLLATDMQGLKLDIACY